MGEVGLKSPLIENQGQNHIHVIHSENDWFCISIKTSIKEFPRVSWWSLFVDMKQIGADIGGLTIIGLV